MYQYVRLETVEHKWGSALYSLANCFQGPRSDTLGTRLETGKKSPSGAAIEEAVSYGWARTDSLCLYLMQSKSLDPQEEDGGTYSN